jgi:methionyl-tRNA formyltransferase
MPSAVVFAYHNVGVRCLSVLLACGVKVLLVVTHRDNPEETIWFDSVEKLARAHALPVISPEDPNTPDLLARMKALGPDFLFSFYYRHMLDAALLAVPGRGAYNMHGSLLPRYRGRVPVNWAVIMGERETGATLHQMVAKPDAGGIVGQQAVPIGPDDTALDVFNKVCEAAGNVLEQALPGLIDGTAKIIPQDLEKGSYYGGRRPDDGRIDWSKSALQVHNLVRGVAPPYPGAFTHIGGRPLRVLRARPRSGSKALEVRPALHASAGRCLALCADGSELELLEMELDGKPFTQADFLAVFGDKPVPLPLH